MVEQNPYERLRTLMDVRFLLTLVIGIIGLGRAGALLFYHLLQNPLVNFKLIDGDNVGERDIGNLYPVSQLGKSKALALDEYASLWNPSVTVNYKKERITRENLERIVEWLSDCSLIFLALDDPEVFEDLVIALHERRPLVASMGVDSANFGLVGWSMPGQTACLECVLNLSGARQGMAVPSLPSDFAFIQNIAAQVGLGILLAGRKGQEKFSNLVHPDYNLLVVSNRPTSGLKTKTPEVPKAVQLLKVNSSCPLCRRG